MIPAHGGQLVTLELSDVEKEETMKRMHKKKRILLSPRELSDLLLMAVGAYSPLTGFMNQDDYLNVTNQMRLDNGILWPLPITLSVNQDQANELTEGEEVVLVDQRNRPCGVLLIQEMYSYDKFHEAEQVYQTTDLNHPGVKLLMQQGEILLGGEVRLIERPSTSFSSYCYDPTLMRQKIAEKGWKTTVAFQTRNPIHRAHEYIQKCALELVDGLIIHPIVGDTKKDDVPADVRMKSYEAIVEKYYPAKHTLLAAFPASMRYAGPREAVFHAICRKNYGCTHMIIGRDHAGVGNYYGTYDAQKLIKSFPTEELGIIPLCFEHTFYCKACENMASSKTCPHTQGDHLILSGTKVREMLRSGQPLPKEFTRPEVADILKKAYEQ